MNRFAAIIGILFFLSGNLYSQKKVTLQVVSKTIEKSFPYNSGYELNIEGEKADVKVESWDKAVVEVYIKISASNTDKDQAAKELEYMQYQVSQVSNKIYLRNYLKVPEKSAKPTSNFKSEYIIKMPADCPVYLKSKFGVVELKDLSNQVRLNSQFSTVGLENIKGFIDLNTRFGELNGKYIDGDMVVNSRRTNILLSELTGNYDLNTAYGQLTFFADPNVTNLKLKSYHTKVFLHSSDLQRFAYNIEAQNTKLNLPDPLSVNLLDTSEDPTIQKLYYKPQREYYANFTIVMTFGEFTLSVDR